MIPINFKYHDDNATYMYMSTAIFYSTHHQWSNYVRRGEAAASGHQAAEGTTEFIQNYLCNLLFNFVWRIYVIPPPQSSDVFTDLLTVLPVIRLITPLSKWIR